MTDSTLGTQKGKSQNQQEMQLRIPMKLAGDATPDSYEGWIPLKSTHDK